jgi:hypothetical protein
MFSTLRNELANRDASSLAFRVTILVSCLVLLSFRLNAEEAKAGWVLDVKGQWAFSGGTTLLAQAASVPAGGQLVNLAPKDGDYIRIADLHGDLLRSLRCSQNGCGQCARIGDTCTAPIEPLPQAPVQPGLIAATWEGLMDLFVGHPERYSIHRSRAIGAETCIAENVVPLDASGNAHVDGLLKKCEPGVYTFEIAPAGATAVDRAERVAKQVTATWNPSEPAGKWPVALAPGLYRVSYTREWRSGEAWILVCASPSFANNQASFEKLSAVVDGWGPQVERDSKAAFKRAYLDYLSRSKGGSDQAR